MEFLNQRINRATYWIYITVLLAFGVVTGFFNVNTSGLSFVLAIPYILRMHDLGWTGMWLVPLYVLPFVLGLATFVAFGPDGLLAGLVVLGLANALWIALLGSLPGQLDTNRYGPAPPCGISLRGGATANGGGSPPSRI